MIGILPIPSGQVVAGLPDALDVERVLSGKKLLKMVLDNDLTRSG